MPACPFGEHIALYHQRNGGLFLFDRLTSEEVSHYRAAWRRSSARGTFGRDEYGIDLEPRPSACDFDPASRAVHAAGVQRSFGSSKLLTARRRSGNVGI